jgi:hypothetical protein
MRDLREIGRFRRHSLQRCACGRRRPTRPAMNTSANSPSANRKPYSPASRKSVSTLSSNLIAPPPCRGHEFHACLRWDLAQPVCGCLSLRAATSFGPLCPIVPSPVPARFHLQTPESIRCSDCSSVPGYCSIRIFAWLHYSYMGRTKERGTRGTAAACWRSRPARPGTTREHTEN